MKEFRKNIQGQFICEECGKTCKSLNGLGIHLYYFHNGKEIYFNKWLKTDEDNCIICHKSTNFCNLKVGNVPTCSKKCKKELTKQTNLKKFGFEWPTQNITITNKTKETCLKRYNKKSYTGTVEYKKSLLKNFNVENNFQRKECKEKSQQTCLNNFGVKNISQSEYAKNKKEETCLKNHGVKYAMQSKEIKERTKQTNLNRYEVEYPGQSAEIKEKSKQTCIKIYGFEYPNQNQEQSNKGFKTRLEIKQYKDTDIWYQGTYEFDFLDKNLDKFPDITRGPTIKYIFQNKAHSYFPDFYIQTLNLVVEVKSTWTYNDIIDPLKKEATIANGFNYIMIVNKDYEKFNRLFI